jgi:HrpA-like RNA helicase
VFLTGQDDVDAAVQLINEEAETLPRNTAGLLVLPLYAGLPHSDQVSLLLSLAQIFSFFTDSYSWVW